MASLWEQTKQLVNDGITYVDTSTNDFVDVLQETNPKIMDEVLDVTSGLDKDQRGDLFVNHIITNPEFRQNFLDAKSTRPEAFKDLMGTLNLDAEQVNQQVALLDNSLVKNVLNNHPDAMKAVLNAEDGQHAEVFQEQLKDYSFRNTLVDATIASPQALKDLVRDVPELSQNPQIQEMMPMLDNKFVMNIARNHRDMVNDVLNPDLQGQQQEIMSNYMARPAVQATAAESVHLYREDAIAYQNSLETPDPELKRLINLPPEVLTASMSAIQNGANPTQTLTQNAVNYEFDPILTLAQTDPEAAGQAFVDKMGEQMGHSGSAAVQANMLELKADPELMKAIGDDLAKHGANIKGELPKLIETDPTKIDNVAIANFGNAYPEMMQVGATLLAAHDPAEAAQTAMDGMRHNLISSIDGVDVAIKTATDAGVNTLDISQDLKLLQEADSLADLKGIKHIDISKLDQNNLLGSVSEVNSIVDGLEATPAFMNGLGTRLADPALAQNLMNNLDSSSSGDLTSLKVVTDSLKEDPEGGLDILASEHFMGLAAERWGTDIMDANIDGFFTDMKTALADFATSETGLMLKQQFGIDLSQMAGSLDGFAGMIKEQITPMISSMGADVANLQMGGGIVASINEKLEPHGGSIGMNSAGGDLSGIVGGAQSHLANTQQYAANVEYAREMGLSGQELEDYINDQVEDRFERELPMEKVVDATSGQVRERTPTELASAQNIENDHDAILAKSKLPGNEPGLDPVLAGG